MHEEETILLEPNGREKPIDREYFYENTRWRLTALLCWICFVFLILICLGICGRICNENFLKALFSEWTLGRLFMLCAIIPSMVMIIGAGGLDLSIGSIMCLTSVLIALMLSKGCSAPVAFVAVIMIALVIGLMNAVLVGLVRLPGAFVTLATAALFRGVAYVISDAQSIFIGQSTFLELLPKSFVAFLLFLVILWYKMVNLW